MAFPSKRETVPPWTASPSRSSRGDLRPGGRVGCGKSQTLRSILGLLKQPGRITGGAIRYKGRTSPK
ncbi:MAG: hypothetical protein ACLT5P_04745 [Flavonifractor plautii]